MTTQTPPSHCSIMDFPNGTQEILHTYPIARMRGRYACKYCKTTHTNWWLMEEGKQDCDVVLCGECEYNSGMEPGTDAPLRIAAYIEPRAAWTEHLPGPREKLCAEESNSPEWQTLVTKARQTNSERDASDRIAGLAPPSGSPFMELRTGLQAISAGLSIQDWECVAEGFVMVQAVEYKLRPFLLELHEKVYSKRA